MQTLTRQQLKDLNAVEHEDFVLVNVLPQEAFNTRHIRTSINIPLENDDFEQLVETVAGTKERKIVLYCKNFDCPLSNEAAEKLEDAGFTQVYDYEGGTEDWFSKKGQQAA